jgi:hypothetical protein
MYKHLAQQLTLPGGGSIQGPIQQGVFDGGKLTIGSILSRAIPFIFMIAGVGLLLMILASGFTLLTSAGDAKKMESGKQRLTNAIIGIIIIIGSFWLVQYVQTILGLETILK